MDLAYQCVQHNKRIEVLVDMEYRQLGKIDKWGISTVGGVSKVWANQQFGHGDVQAYQQ
jgi:hypothetical protein